MCLNADNPVRPYHLMGLILWQHSFHCHETCCNCIRKIHWGEERMLLFWRNVVIITWCQYLKCSYNSPNSYAKQTHITRGWFSWVWFVMWLASSIYCIMYIHLPYLCQFCWQFIWFSFSMFIPLVWKRTQWYEGKSMSEPEHACILLCFKFISQQWNNKTTSCARLETQVQTCLKARPTSPSIQPSLWQFCPSVCWLYWH